MQGKVEGTMLWINKTETYEAQKYSFYITNVKFEYDDSIIDALTLCTGHGHLYPSQ